MAHPRFILAMAAWILLLPLTIADGLAAGGAHEPLAGAATSAPPPNPRPALKTPKRGAFPFKPWSYARAYTYNFFPSKQVQTRVLSQEGTWSAHITSVQLISEDRANRAAMLTAETRGTIEMTKCTFPRHAIVYFDREDKPVASIDVCFECEAVLASPDYPKPEPYDWERAGRRFERTLPKWRKLFEAELGLPIDYKKTIDQR